MIRRRVMAAGLMAAALLPLLGMQAALAAPKRAVAPRVRLLNPRLSLKTVKSGKPVRAEITVDATGGATVSAVNVRLVRAGAAASSVGMTRVGKKWNKTFNAPANFSGRTVNVEVWADAQTSLGARSLKIGTLKVTSTAIDVNSPPPPPPI